MAGQPYRSGRRLFREPVGIPEVAGQLEHFRKCDRSKRGTHVSSYRVDIRCQQRLSTSACPLEEMLTNVYHYVQDNFVSFTQPTPANGSFLSVTLNVVSITSRMLSHYCIIYGSIIIVCTYHQEEPSVSIAPMLSTIPSWTRTSSLPTSISTLCVKQSSPPVASWLRPHGQTGLLLNTDHLLMLRRTMRSMRT